MKPHRSIAHDDAAISEALGSRRPRPVGEFDLSPPGLLALAHRLNERLVSTGGRPTDPSWTLSRRVPFSHETWEALNALAERLSSASRAVAPAQVAAQFVEDSIVRLDEAAERAFAERLTGRETPDP